MSAISVIFLVSCKKKGETTPAPSVPGTPPVAKPIAVKQDTIPDGAFLKVMLQQDSSTIDETLVKFDHTASANYSNSHDAVYFPGQGIGSLASLTGDSVSCALQSRPFTPGKGIRLKITAKNDGIYILKTSFTQNIPASMGIWLKDAARKDSLNIRIWSYSFYVTKSDTNTFGSKRFTVVLR